MKKRFLRLNNSEKISRLLAVGLKQYLAGRWLQAEACYESVLQVAPQHADALHMRGLIKLQACEYALAIDLIGAAIQHNGKSAHFHHSLAIAYHRQGDLSAAIAGYERSISLNRNDASVHYHLASALFVQGEWQAAADRFGHVLQLEPHHAEAHYYLGSVHAQQDNLEKAIECYQRALTLNPDSVEFLQGLAGTLHRRGALTEAADAYERLLVLQPDDAGALNDLGTVRWEQDKLVEAMRCYVRALRIKPDWAAVYCNLGAVLDIQNNLSAAMEMYRRALTLQSDCAEAHHNLGCAFWKQGHLKEATTHLRNAVALNPGCAEANYSLAIALADEGDLEGAADNCRRALSVKPEYPEAHSFRADLQLLHGEFSIGWREFEYRWQSKDLRESERGFSQPLWRGEPLEGARILLHAEQGFGDTLQFVRYVPLVAARGGQVVLEVQSRLYRLISGMRGATEVIAFGDKLPEFTWQCPLMSLPLAFGTEMSTIPASIPYLHADAAEERDWSHRLKGRGLRVGLVWSGEPAHKRNHLRSIPLALLAPLTQLEGITFYALQMGPASAELEQTQSKTELIDLGPQQIDFASTAAIVSNLDMVISVDTSVAHLTGALGKPVWILLPYAADWRWLLDRENNPWYPTARLFRQPAPKDWDSVVRRLVVELQSITTGAGRTPASGE